MFKKRYSIKKAKNFLNNFYAYYKKKKKKLNKEQSQEIETLLLELDSTIKTKNKNNIKPLIQKLETIENSYLKRSRFEKFINSFSTLILALAIAIVIRQVAFENYTIPSGSMRPTLKEKDFLLVSKTAFAIDKPTRTGHFYFNNDLLKRGDISIFTTANMDIKNSDHLYFFILPGKKQFIKRTIAKPGDTIYFHGGLIYGIDEKGNDIEDFKKPYFKNIEHIPFIKPFGNLSYIQTKNSKKIILSEMNTPLAQIYPKDNYGVLLTNKKPPFSKNFSPKHYFDIWGFKNYATAKIIKKEYINKNLPPANYYLELKHHPDIEKISFKKDIYQNIIPKPHLEKSYIPLDNKDLQNIFKSLYTCRFVIKNNSAYRYSFGSRYKDLSPKLNIPNGTYEFQDGIAYSVNFFGVTKKLKTNHPIYNVNTNEIITLYNLGIEVNTLFSPKNKNSFTPSRYAYFKENSLYLMGHPIFAKESLKLISFIENEKTKKIDNPNYFPFIPSNPPILKDGSIDKEFIYKYGLTIPKNHFLMLGDNHAASSDSRDFGFVPKENLRGRASFVYWPFGKRFGKSFQPNHNFSTFPNIFVWSVIIIISIICYIYIKRKQKIKF